MTILLQGLTLPYVLRWAGLEGDEAREDETHKASIKATQAALDALPDIARSIGAPPDMVERIKADYEGHLEELRAEGDEDRQAVRYERLEHELRLAVLQRKRQAVTALRDANKIDDCMLRDLQAGMDIEEIQLLGPAPLSEAPSTPRASSMAPTTAAGTTSTAPSGMRKQMNTATPRWWQRLP